MTPSPTSAAPVLSRNAVPSQVLDRPRAGLFRRIFDRTEIACNPSRKDADRITNDGEIHRDFLLANGVAEARVSEFLEEAVTELWREEQSDPLISSMRDFDGATKSLDGESAHKNSPSMPLNRRSPGLDSNAPMAALPAWKRSLDLLLILLSAPLWLPLTLLLMGAVRLSSPGPIFYRQERVGYQRRAFMIYKFRSMKVDAETQVHEAHFERLMRESVPMVKLDGKGDPRILPWGRLMRATGLDELPQIFNVIRGEMSLVGPRPCTIPEFARYLPWQQERVNAFPGLTGYWQVNGKNRTTFNEMIDMDIFYSKNLSLGMDLVILLQTLPALVMQTAESFMGSRTRTRNGDSFPSNANSPEGI